jgi:hypothetical protein
MTTLYGSQQDNDVLTGSGTRRGPARMSHGFRGSWRRGTRAWRNRPGFVDEQELSAPAHSRKILLHTEVPIATDKPYAEA